MRQTNMNKDPFHLDQLRYSEVLREISMWNANSDIDKEWANDPPDKLPHPLLNDPQVASLYKHIQGTCLQLIVERKLSGGMADDSYFAFNEGLELRPEVVARIAIDFINNQKGE